MPDYDTPYAPPPRRRGCGCVSCGCTALLVLILLCFLSLCGVVYWADSWLNSVSTTKNTEVYQGTEEERESVQRKIAALQDSTKNSEETTTRFSMNELNIMIANTPADWHLQQHLYLSSTNNVLHADVALPLKQFISWATEGSNLPLQIDFVPAVVGGNLTLEIKTIKYPGGTFDDPDKLKAANQSINEQIKQAIAKDPKVSDALSHVDSLKVENDEVVVTTH